MIHTLLTNKKVRVALIVFVIVYVLAFIFLSLRSPSNSVDEFPEEGTSQDYSTHARIVDGEDLFTVIGSDRRYDSLSRDLFVFGETAYSEYRSSDTQVIGFQVTMTGGLQDQKLTIEGKYGSINNKIKISIVLLNNDRVSTSITDTKTKFNIDSELPSNTKLNQFIATLPKSYEGYSAEYARNTDSVTLFLDEKSPELGELAYAEMQKIIDDGSYSRDRFQIIFPVESFGQ